MTPHQQEIFDALKACGQETYLWKPSDIEGIADILRAPLDQPVSKGW